MNKIILYLYKEVGRRPLCYGCIAAILLICIIQQISFGQKTAPVYRPGGNNVFTTSNIREGDTVYLNGQIKSLSIREVGGRMTCIALISHVKNRSGQMVTSSFSKIQAHFSPEEKIKIGQYIEFGGKLSYFDEATNPGEFNAYEYYRNIDILFDLYDCCVTGKSTGYSKLGQFLYATRLKGEDILAEYLEPDDAAIMKAMIFGNKNEISQDVKELFQKNGIAHILAISGLHISLIAMGLYRLLFLVGLDNRLCAFISEIVIILYGVMVGFPISAIRAVCMFTIYLTGRLLHRTYDIMTALSFTLTLVLFLYPGRVFDSGLQLSFMAVVGIGYFLARFERHIFKPPKWLSPGFISFFVFASTLPVLLSSYYEIALYSVLLNLIIIPLMSILMFAGIGLVIVGSIPYIRCIASMLTYIVSMILRLYKGTCAFLTSKGMGRFNAGCPKMWQVLVFYLLLWMATGGKSGILKWLKKKTDICSRGGRMQSAKGGMSKDKQDLRRGRGGMTEEKTVFYLKERTPAWGRITRAIVIMMIAFVVLFYNTDRGMKVWMLDVGQGDCMVIRNDNGKFYIIDGGSTSKKSVGERIIVPMLKFYGVNEIEAVFVTHPDEDHMNGIIELLTLQEKECIRVKRVCTYEGFLTSEEMSDIIIAARDNGTDVCGIERGQRIVDGRLEMAVLFPYDGHPVDDLNNASLVMRVSYGEFDMITTGDIEEEGEIELVAMEKEEETGKVKRVTTTTAEKEVTNDKQRQIDILKVAHHGSKSSSSVEMMEWASPDVALISVGKNNRYGHPSPEVIDRLNNYGIKCFRTDELGCIICAVKKDGGYELINE